MFFKTRNPDSGKRSRRVFNATLFIVLAIAIFWISTRLVNASGNLVMQARKITSIMKLIQEAYVKEPDLDVLAEGAIEGMLKRLDPHSIYIPYEQQKEISERDVGEFEGIGISFVIQNELITVISPINGTPAERLGLRSGDRIIEIDGVNAYGITTDEVFKKLRGPKGTTVDIKVAREGYPEPLDFTIVRDKIPINSITASFMIDDSTGYIQLTQFMQTTSEELETALLDLESKGMTRLIFDLRNNEGGRLTQAVEVADKFIPGGKVIVSREGRINSNDSTYISTNEATHPLFDLIALINGGSASASEIVSGAIKDLDRGLIAGTNSFGKGLVQYPYQMRDGAVIRLSTAHWFTPSGRLVQRPYDKGRGEYYAVHYRDENESEDEESENNGEVFYSLAGRELYSLSGITPDVEIEPILPTVATARLISGRVLFTYAEKLIKDKGLEPDGNFDEFIVNFDLTEDELKGLIQYAKDKDYIYTDEIFEKDKDYLARSIEADIAQLLWSDREHYYKARIHNDEVVQEALKHFNEAKEIAAIWR